MSINDIINDESIFTNYLDQLEESEAGIVITDNANRSAVQIRKNIVDFITDVILRHEQFIYELVEKNMKSDMANILNKSNITIYQLISTLTDDFFNNLYFDIQNEVVSDVTTTIKNLASELDYGPHILLNNLYKITVDAHFEIPREELIITDKIDTYLNRIVMHINGYIMTKNIYEIFDKHDGDDIQFVVMKDGIKPFNSKIIKTET